MTRIGYTALESCDYRRARKKEVPCALCRNSHLFDGKLECWIKGVFNRLDLSVRKDCTCNHADPLYGVRLEKRVAALKTKKGND